jgi:hypothetical protein
VVEEPIIPYLQWELLLKVRAEYGELIRVIDADAIGCGSSGVTLSGEFRVVRGLVSGSPVSVRV